MPRLLAIDYGRKRCGIAVTDPLQICANALTTVRACDLLQWLTDYCSREQVEKIIVGLPTQLNGAPSESTRYIEPFINQLRKAMPEMPIERYDERFTSTIAHQSMLQGGMKKMDRRNKDIVDRIAASIILNDYLQSKNFC